MLFWSISKVCMLSAWVKIVDMSVCLVYYLLPCCFTAPDFDSDEYSPWSCFYYILILQSCDKWVLIASTTRSFMNPSPSSTLAGPHNIIDSWYLQVVGYFSLWITRLILFLFILACQQWLTIHILVTVFDVLSQTGKHFLVDEKWNVCNLTACWTIN